MPKRRHEDETNKEKWLRKMEKYKRKLEAKRARRIIYSDEEDDVQNEGRLIWCFYYFIKSESCEFPMHSLGILFIDIRCILRISYKMKK